MLSENGFSVPDKIQYTILEDTDKIKNIVLHIDHNHFEYSHGSQYQASWKKIMEKVKIDKNFKKELLSNPYQILKQHDISCSPDIKYKIIEETDSNRYLVITAMGNKGLHEEDFLNASGGGFGSSGFCTDSSTG